MGAATKSERRRGKRDDGLGSSEAAEALRWEFHDLDFSVNKSRRYHEKLAAFYGWWREASRVFTVVAGSGAFLLVASGTGTIGVAATAIAALWAVLDLILMPDKKSERHVLLRQRFTELAKEIAEAKVTSEQFAVLQSARLRLEADEPPCKRLVDLEARNDEARSRNYSPDEQVPLSSHQRRWGRYFDFDMERLERWKETRQRMESSAS